jgi:hypothetical protein
MEYEKRIRCLENYRVRTISKDIVSINSKGEKIVDTSSPKYFYGQIPEFKIDKDFNYILDADGEKIPNVIPIDIFLKHKFDDIGIFTNSIYTDGSDKITDETPELPDPEVAGYFCYGDEEHTMNVYSCYAAQTITQIQDAQADGFSVFLTSTYGSPQAALAACHQGCSAPTPGGLGDVEHVDEPLGPSGNNRCVGEFQMSGLSNNPYVILNGSPLPQVCCTNNIIGTKVYWDGQYCRPTKNNPPTQSTEK